MLLRRQHSCLCKQSLTNDHSHPFHSRIPNIKLSPNLPCHQIYHTDCNLVLPEGATEAVKSHPASELKTSLPQLGGKGFTSYGLYGTSYVHYIWKLFFGMGSSQQLSCTNFVHFPQPVIGLGSIGFAAAWL